MSTPFLSFPARSYPLLVRFSFEFGLSLWDSQPLINCLLLTTFDTMLTTTLFNGLLGASIVLAAPVFRRVTIDQAATAEAQQRDDTATRAFTAAEIKVCSEAPLSSHTAHLYLDQ
jgi:hypothetical protein